MSLFAVGCATGGSAYGFQEVSTNQGYQKPGQRSARTRSTVAQETKMGERLIEFMHKGAALTEEVECERKER